MSNRRNTSRQLRDLELFSGNDQFMQNGHQIINSNRANAGPRRKNAAWAASDAEVQKLLQARFPKLKIDENQRKRAGRWVRVIHLYFRSEMSVGDVAKEIGMTRRNTDKLIRRIRMAQIGLRTDGSGAYRRHGGSQTSLGDLGEETN